MVGVHSLFQLSISRIERLIINSMGTVSPEVISSVQAILSEGVGPFKELSTTNQQNNYIKANFSFVVRHNFPVVIMLVF